MDGFGPEQRDYLFEQFRLDPVARTLVRAGRLVPLSARLFDTLLYLVRNPDRPVSRAELLREVWPGRVIEDGNLGKAVSSVREALKEAGATDEMIVTIARRGYRFASVVTLAPAPNVHAEIDAASPAAVARRFAAGSPASAASLVVTCVFVFATAAFIWAPREPGAAPASAAFAPPPRSVAVLPFSNLSGNPAEEYVSDGVSEELIGALGRIASLRVASRLSSFSFKGTQATATAIGRALDVGTVLEGSIRRDGRHQRISAALIDTRTGYQVWSRSFDRDADTAIALQAHIAEAVIASLKIALIGDEAARLVAGGTTNARAFDDYLLAMQFVAASGEDADRRAIDVLSEAIAADPAYAMAYVQRARSRMALAINTLSSDSAARAAAIAAALADAEHAAALAPDLGAAHAAIGYVLKCTLSELRRAGAELDEAVIQAPGDASTLMSYAFFQLDLGHLAAAVDAARHAAALDPLTPKTQRMLAIVLVYAKRDAEALAALDRARHLQPLSPSADRIYLGIIEVLQGDAAAARNTCDGEPDWNNLACRAWADHALGRAADAEAAFQSLVAVRGDAGAYAYAQIQARWNNHAAALHWLDVAYRLRDPGLIEIKVDPMLASLRGTSGYAELVRKLDFPP